jgi:hypothetical protein
MDAVRAALVDPGTHGRVHVPADRKARSTTPRRADVFVLASGGENLAVAAEGGVVRDAGDRSDRRGRLGVPRGRGPGILYSADAAVAAVERCRDVSLRRRLEEGLRRGADDGTLS